MSNRTKLNITPEAIISYKVKKRSIDARQKNVIIHLKIEVKIKPHLVPKNMLKPKTQSSYQKIRY